MSFCVAFLTEGLDLLEPFMAAHSSSIQASRPKGIELRSSLVSPMRSPDT